MIKQLVQYLHDHRDPAYRLLRIFAQKGERFLLRSQIVDAFGEFAAAEDAEGRPLENTPLAQTFLSAQESAFQHPWYCLAVRPSLGRWVYARFHVEDVNVQEMSGPEYLAFKEWLITGRDPSQDWMLEVDLAPFNREFPKMKEARSIGRGVEFLNRHLSSRIFMDSNRGNRMLFEFLKMHHVQGITLMLNNKLASADELRDALRAAEQYLARQDSGATWDDVAGKLADLGFERGWGRKVSRIRTTMRLLADLLEAPDHDRVERFLDCIPMIFNIAILSPHGFFGQNKVLGLPDTGGQVVYILDQVRALEHEMRRRIEEQGLDIKPQVVVITRLIPEARGTTCNQPIERIQGTEYARILRVPFRNARGEAIPHWISRFEIWPYLEQFSLDCQKELITELQGRPDLIIGNYSDGNLVASLMSERLHVTHCTIAHALEKTKYLFSGLYWAEMEERYHFSCQFTADLIAMNTADFIITSTYQEIAGNETSIGQYESYSAFTMPGLLRVVEGINVFDPKFNIVSPGADPNVYFPNTEKERRLVGLEGELNELVFGGTENPDARGRFVDSSKPILFTIARLDKIKNVTGLTEWFAKSERLRGLANLLIVAGTIHPDNSGDEEERGAIHHMHHLFDEHHLDGSVRWLGMRLDKNFAGELYRTIADRRGAFVQPALFEAFGLTVIEAMISGLPTFATMYGGPLEIIEDGISGYHIDPNHGEASAGIIADFLERCREKPEYWERLSQGAIDRVRSRYTWELYASRLMTLSRVYGFWKYVTNLERDETRRYLQMLYGLLYRPRAASIPQS